MQVARVTASAGRGWVASGFALMRRFPASMMMVTFCWWLVLALSGALPVVGAFAQFVLVPVLAVGVMHAVRAVAQQRSPTPAMLFAGVTARRGRGWMPLVGLGVLNAAATVLAIGASALVDNGLLFEIVTGQVQPDDARLARPGLPWQLMTSGSLFMLVLAPMQMALWYAPVFCAWHELPMIKSMFFSFVAVLRNKWAFLQYAIVWMAVAFAISSAATAVLAVLGQPMLTRIAVLMPIALLMQTAVFCSYWPTYREVVVDGGPGASGLSDALPPPGAAAP